MSQQRPRFPAQVLPSATAAVHGRQVGRVGVQPLTTPVPLQSKRPAARSAPGAAGPGAAGLGADQCAPGVPSQQGARARMAKRLAADCALQPEVVAAMAQVPRHAFIDSALVGQAYEENSLPIGFGQTISKPSVVARMLSLVMQPYLQFGGGRIPGRVLEVGTGCGYQAMVLSQIASEVYSIERLRGLHERARANLRPMRVANLHLLFGDGMAGYAQGGPYAAIVSAAGGEAIPQAWLDQLAVGGRIVAPTSSNGAGQALVVVDKTPVGLRQQTLESVHFVPLKSGVD